MSDLITRQAAIDAIDRMDIPEDMCVFEILSHIELEIGTLPSAQPKRGRWERKAGGVIQCSVCAEEYRNQLTMMGKPMFQFCPVCGADMRGGQDEQN